MSMYERVLVPVQDTLFWLCTSQGLKARTGSLLSLSALLSLYCWWNPGPDLASVDGDGDWPLQQIKWLLSESAQMEGGRCGKGARATGELAELQSRRATGERLRDGGMEVCEGARDGNAEWKNE